MDRRTARRWKAAAAVAFALLGGFWGGWLGRMHLAGEASLLDRLEAVTLDWRQLVAGRRDPPAGVAVVAIDDATVAAEGRYPIPRGELARLIGLIAAAGAKTIAIDLLLLEPSVPAADEGLAASLGKAATVIAAAGVFADEAPPARRRHTPDVVPITPGVPVVRRVLWPAEPFRENQRIGLVNVATDAGGTPRHIPLLFRDGTAFVPSIVLAAAATAAGSGPKLSDAAVAFGDLSQALDLGYHLVLHPYGPRGTIRTVSAAAILNEGREARDLAGRTVVVGTTALGAGDTFPTAFDRTMPGVEVLATGIANLLAGDGLDRSVRVRQIDAAAAVILPILVVLALAWRRTALGLAVVAAILAGWVVATYAAYLDGVWLSVAIPLAAAIPTAALFGAASFWMSRRTIDHLTLSRDQLERLQSPVLARRLAEDPAFLAQPVTQDGAILFFDVSGFTGFSEAIGPELTRTFQSELVDLVADTVTGLGGGLITFLGDGAMIVFGLPEPREDDAARALEALTRLEAAFRPWLAQWSADAPRPLTMVFGLQAGPIVVSRLGGHQQQTVTVAGDTVNVASRLMEVAKTNGRLIAVGAPVFAALPDDARGILESDYDPPQTVAIRGRSAPEAVRLGRHPAAAG